MTRMRTFLIACLVGGLSIGGFLTRRASAQLEPSGEIPASYEFPSTWGDFKAVLIENESTYVYFFESPGGSIRKVTVPNGGRGIQWVEVIRRPIPQNQSGPGILR